MKAEIEGALERAALWFDSLRPRSRQKVMGASDIGPCIRKGAYIYHQTPESDAKVSGMPAVLGTWIHKMALDTMEWAYGIFQEILVQHPSGKLRGHIDAIWLAERHMRFALGLEVQMYDDTTVEDLKTKADDRMIDTVRKYGPPKQERRQVYAYAWLLSTFGTKVGRTGNRAKQRFLRAIGPVQVDKVRLRYMGRDRGDEYVWEEDLDPEMVQEAAERFQWVLNSERPEDLPREQRGPGLSYVCDSCPFRTECWGAAVVDEAGVWPQAILVREGETTNEEQVRLYQAGMTLEREGKILKENAKAILSGVPVARKEVVQFGDAGRLSYSGGNPKGEVEDVDAMRDLLIAAEVPIPMKDGGLTSRSISVRPPQ